MFVIYNLGGRSETALKVACHCVTVPFNLFCSSGCVEEHCQLTKQFDSLRSDFTVRVLSTLLC